MKYYLCILPLIFVFNTAYAVGSKSFYSSGETRYLYKYKHGKREGITIELDKNGNKIAEWFYKKGKLQ